MIEPYCPHCSCKTHLVKPDDSTTSSLMEVFECRNCRSRFPVSDWVVNRILREIR